MRNVYRLSKTVPHLADVTRHVFLCVAAFCLIVCVLELQNKCFLNIFLVKEPNRHTVKQLLCVECFFVAAK